jgi:hypothetical protein
MTVTDGVRRVAVVVTRLTDGHVHRVHRRCRCKDTMRFSLELPEEVADERPEQGC